MTRPVALPAEDAVELAEILEFLYDWTATHANTLAVEFFEFTAGGFTLEELREALARFAFVLGGDSSRLFGDVGQ